MKSEKLKKGRRTVQLRDKRRNDQKWRFLKIFSQIWSFDKIVIFSVLGPRRRWAEWGRRNQLPWADGHEQFKGFNFSLKNQDFENVSKDLSDGELEKCFSKVDFFPEKQKRQIDWDTLLPANATIAPPPPDATKELIDPAAIFKRTRLQSHMKNLVRDQKLRSKW